MKKIILTLLFLAWTVSAHGTTYWASTSGGAGSCGAASGTSDPGVYRTLTQGMACLAAGDTLILKAGTYVQAIIDPTLAAGSAGAHTTIRSEVQYGAILRPTSTQFVLGLASANYHHITFDGIDFDGSACTTCSHVIMLTWGGAGPSNATHTVTVTNSKIHSTTSPPPSSKTCFQTTGAGNNIQLTYSEIYNCGYAVYHAVAGGSGPASGGYYGRNYIHDTFEYGLHVYSDFGNVNDVLIEGNYVYNTVTSAGYCGGGILVSSGARHIVRYNTVRRVGGTCGSGIVTHYGATTPFIYNNVVYDANGDGIELSAGGAGAVVRNNISVENIFSNFNNATGATQSNNTITGLASDHFVNAASGDFTLKSTSAAINNGTNTIGTITYGGVPVNVVEAFNGSSRDRGTHESIGTVTCEVGLIAANILDCTVQNNVFPPVLPATGITGFTVRRALGNNVVTAAARQGTNGFRLTLTDNFTGGQACDFSYAQTGNFTDSALIGNTSSQELFAITNQSCTNNVGAGGGATVTQSHVGMFTWDGNEGSGPQIGSTNAATLRAMVHGKYLARFGLKTTVADTPATNYALRYSKNGGAYTAVPSFTGVEDVGICDAPGVSASNTTQRLTSGSFEAGRVVEVGAGIPTITMTNGESTELLYPICYGPNLVAGTDNIKFRLYKDDGTALAYDTNATLSVDVVTPGLSGL
jgi:hypothetical protein